ncbi:MAG: trypsin-like serine protease [Candidatus Saccharibacteria bacterium]|nr:trypsin-like serine protease [Pseudorhodobacter sp.]
MILRFALSLIGIMALGATCALAEARLPRMITAAEAPLWNAVGRLNIAGDRYCSAALISPTEAVTATHCLFNPRTRNRIQVSDLRLVLGLRPEGNVAVIKVAGTAILPGYVYTGPVPSLATIAQDVALLRLDRPVTPDEATPLRVTRWPEDRPEVDIVGFGRDRPYLASIRVNCPILADMVATALLNCKVVPGLSGAPVVLTQTRTVVAVMSALVGTRLANTQSMIVPIEPHLAALRALLK